MATSTEQAPRRRALGSGPVRRRAAKDCPTWISGRGARSACSRYCWSRCLIAARSGARRRGSASRCRRATATRPRTLRKGADLAATHAQHPGGGTFEFASAELNAKSYERFRLGSQLRGAAQRGELRSALPAQGRRRERPHRRRRGAGAMAASGARPAAAGALHSPRRGTRTHRHRWATGSSSRHCRDLPRGRAPGTATCRWRSTWPKRSSCPATCAARCVARCSTAACRPANW